MIDFNKLYIDCRNLITDLIPHFKRQEKFVEFMNLFADEFQITSDTFYTLVSDTWDLMAYSSQVGVYEEFLNDKFDNYDRRITVTNNDVGLGLITVYKAGEYDPTPTTIYLQAENKSPWIVYLESELSSLTFFNYTINVPLSLWNLWTTDQQNYFTAQASIYLLAGKQFDVQTF